MSSGTMPDGTNAPRVGSARVLSRNPAAES